MADTQRCLVTQISEGIGRSERWRFARKTCSTATNRSHGNLRAPLPPMLPLTKVTVRNKTASLWDDFRPTCPRGHLFLSLNYFLFLDSDVGHKMCCGAVTGWNSCQEWLKIKAANAKTSKEVGVYIYTYCIYTNGPLRFPVPMIEMVADKIDPTHTWRHGIDFSKRLSGKVYWLWISCWWLHFLVSMNIINQNWSRFLIFCF